jgi:hypothetical protein
MRTVDIVRVRELLNYDPETGLFTWRTARRGAAKGAVAGSKRKDGYVVIRIDYVPILAHRLAWAHVTGSWPKEEIDHRNLDPSDNRLCNLRAATRSQNHANRHCYKTNTSGLKGVSWKKARNGWEAQIRKSGKKFFLGVFQTKEEAHAAYVAAAVGLYGEFARA